MPIYKTDTKENGQQVYRVRINFVDDHGKKRQLTRKAVGMAEAKQLEAKLLREVKNKEITVGKISVRALYDEYIEAQKHEVRETSLNKTRNNLSTHVLPLLSNVQVDKLNVPVLNKWKLYINEKNLAFRTKQNIFSCFRAMLNYAVKMQYIPTNPLHQIGNFKDAYEINSKEKLRFYTANEFKQYISCAKQNAQSLSDWGYYVFFNIAFYTGMRKGEINALKWSDIEDGLIHVRRSIAQKLKGEDRETPPKNKSSYRTLQMPQPLIDILDEHRTRQQAVPGWTSDLRICGGTRCLRDTSISNKNIKYAAEASLEPIRIHDFRHSHASLLANEGINIQEIARRLGHAKVEITWNTYSHLYPREEERAVSVLNKIVI